MGSGMANLPDDKPMPPEVVEALSTLLADALVADVKGYPDLALEPGAARKARAQSRHVESSAQTTSSTTPAAAAYMKVPDTS